MFPYKNFIRKNGFIPVALVFGAEWVNGLAIIRALGEKRVNIYALSKYANAIGFYSRYIKNYIIHPDPYKNPKLFLEVMINTGEKLLNKNEKGVIFPVSDLEVKLLTENKEKLQKYFIFTFSDIKSTVIRCIDKKYHFENAVKNSVPVPKTYFPNKLEELYFDLQNNKIDYPILFKARHSLVSNIREKYRVILIRDQNQLNKIVKLATKDKVPFLIQEVIPGGDENLYTLGTYMSKKGSFKAIFTGRKLRQKPPHFGICRVGESIYSPKIIGYGYKLLKAINFFGISQVEFKYDYRDDEFKLMEINPRSWSWIGLPVKMGINIPYIAFCDVLGINEKCPPPHICSKRYLWISIEDDILTSIKFKDGFPLKHLLSNMNNLCEAYFSLKDPIPWVYHINELMSNMIKRYAN